MVLHPNELTCLKSQKDRMLSFLKTYPKSDISARINAGETVSTFRLSGFQERIDYLEKLPSSYLVIDTLVEPSAIILPMYIFVSLVGDIMKFHFISIIEPSDELCSELKKCDRVVQAVDLEVEEVDSELLLVKAVTKRDDSAIQALAKDDEYIVGRVAGFFHKAEMKSTRGGIWLKNRGKVIRLA